VGSNDVANNLIGSIKIEVVVYWTHETRVLEFSLMSAFVPHIPSDVLLRAVLERNDIDGRLCELFCDVEEESSPLVSCGFTTHFSDTCLSDPMRYECKLSDLREQLVAAALEHCKDIRALLAVGSAQILSYPARRR
jgi:hypothetical protein